MTRSPRPAVWALAAASLLLSLVAGRAAASAALVASVEELTRQSDAVVRGRVEGQVSRWSDDGLRIFTFVDLRVTERWKGAGPGRISLRLPGGVVGGVGQRVLGAPVFGEGEEVVVFVKAAGPHLQVTGLAQGKFAVKDMQAVNDTRGLDLVERPLGAGERRAAPMPVSELERRVRSAR